MLRIQYKDKDEGNHDVEDCDLETELDVDVTLRRYLML